MPFFSIFSNFGSRRFLFAKKFDKPKNLCYTYGMLQYDLVRFYSLLHSVGTLVGAAITFYDTSFEPCPNIPKPYRASFELRFVPGFCHTVKHCMPNACRASDIAAFEAFKHSEKDFEYYVCHCGFVEIKGKIKNHDGEVIGYVLCGPFRKAETLEKDRQFVKDVAARFQLDEKEELVKFEAIPFFDESKYEALAFLLPQLFLYMENQRMVFPKSFFTSQVEPYLNDNLGNDLSIPAMCRALSVSKKLLYRTFKEATDLTPLQYITELRIKKACELLTMTDHTLPEIAEKVGFINYSYFIKIFKQITGKKPSDYRVKGTPPPLSLSTEQYFFPSIRRKTSSRKERGLFTFPFIRNGRAIKAPPSPYTIVSTAKRGEPRRRFELARNPPNVVRLQRSLHVNFVVFDGNFLHAVSIELIGRVEGVVFKAKFL